MQAAVEMLENLLIFRKRNPRHLMNLDINDQKTIVLLENGCFIPLIEKDHLGRQVIIIFKDDYYERDFNCSNSAIEFNNELLYGPR